MTSVWHFICYFVALYIFFRFVCRLLSGGKPSRRWSGSTLLSFIARAAPCCIGTWETDRERGCLKLTILFHYSNHSAGAAHSSGSSPKVSTVLISLTIFCSQLGKTITACVCKQMPLLWEAHKCAFRDLNKKWMLTRAWISHAGSQPLVCCHTSHEDVPTS